jgi:hypothetical protein
VIFGGARCQGVRGSATWDSATPITTPRARRVHPALVAIIGSPGNDRHRNWNMKGHQLSFLAVRKWLAGRAVTFAAFLFACCRGNPSRPEGAFDFFAVEEQSVTSVEYRTSDVTVVLRRAVEGKRATFMITERDNASGHARTCRSSVALDLVVRPLSNIHGVRMLNASEVDRLQQTTGAQDGLLRIQDVVAHDNGNVEPPQWRLYPQFDSPAPVVAIATRDESCAWEVDTPKGPAQPPVSWTARSTLPTQRSEMWTLGSTRVCSPGPSRLRGRSTTTRVTPSWCS